MVLQLRQHQVGKLLPCAETGGHTEEGVHPHEAEINKIIKNMKTKSNSKYYKMNLKAYKQTFYLKDIIR